MKPENVRRDPDTEMSFSRGAIEAAAANTQAPRRVREVEISFGERFTMLGGSNVLRNAPLFIVAFVFIKLLVLSWLPHPSPVLLAVAVCICFCSSLRGHRPDDMRYHGLRFLLLAASGVLLAVRWVSGLANGWENNCWFVVGWLPDSMRGWGDLDSTLRWLLVDPFALLLTGCWLGSTWVLERASLTLKGQGSLWTKYLVPKEYSGAYQFSNIEWLSVLPLLFVTLPATTGDWVYALALGLGSSFFVAYVVMVEMTDYLCVANKGVHDRARHFWKFSDRRYAVLNAISVIPRLLLLTVVGALAIFAARHSQWPSLIPLVVVLGGSYLLYPRHVGLSWMALETFEKYPGDHAPQAGVFDLTEVVRPQEARENLIRFGVFAWVPFVYGCVYHFLPGWPTIDEWGVRWPDLYVKQAILALAVMCVLPTHLMCGVLRACFGPLLGKFAKEKTP